MTKIIYSRMFCGLAILILTFLSACSQPEKASIIQPHYGSIQKTFTELARTRLDKIYDINMPLTGKLARIQLEPGDHVKQDQILAYLIQTPWLEAVQESRARTATMHALYLNEKRQLERQEVLAQKGFATASILDEIRSRMQAWQAQIKESEAHLALMLYNLKISVLRSPVDGIILKRFTQGEKWLMEGSPLLQIGNLSDLEVVSEVLSQQAQELKIGDPVILTSSDNSVTLKGQIKRIDPAGFTKLSALGVEEQRVNVVIKILNTKVSDLGVGYRLLAKFFIGSQQKNALIIPRFSALQDNEGNFYVFKVVNQRLHKQIIDPGIWTDTQVSVLKGLNVTDEIISEPTSEMYDGMGYN
ncbi:MAG: efflux RND transporter periplasmic adaptor subunit [Gammaproteobacteria bacterium]|nr:efflux RND transporter periplasmic adaptor subunit [Gammaproteobacteria bacterium]